MSIEVCVLASGSGGNCTLIRTPAGSILLDAGIGPRAVARRLNGTGALVADIRAIVLTHLDADHFSFAWARQIVSHQIPVFCHDQSAGRVASALEEVAAGFIVGFGGPFEPLAGLRLTPIPVPHDQESCSAFVVEGFGVRIGYATDLGRVPAELIEKFRSLDIVAIESNYDPQMQLGSPRPWFLKRRIMDGRGHLSNQQAFQAVRQILDSHETRGSRLPSHVVLLHRSRQCNCPQIVRKVFSRDQRLRGRLTLAEQFERSAWLRVGKLPPLIGEQLELAWTTDCSS